MVVAGPEFIDEHSRDGAGWARFSKDRKHRYVIRRCVTTRALPSVADDSPLTTVVFCMLNPSKASANKPDNTWTKCCTFASLWGADLCEAVNLDSFITSKPNELFKLPIEQRGGDEVNNRQILERCGAFVDEETRSRIKIVCAWGQDGARDGRGEEVRSMLIEYGLDLYRIDADLADGDQPRHPLARGKYFVPLTAKMVRWERTT